MVPMPAAERRARLGDRHRLAAAAASVTEVANAVLALHATDPATVFLSVAARLDPGSVAQTEAALYQERSVVRVAGMRRTVFVVPAELVPVVSAAAARGIAAKQRRVLTHQLTAAGVAKDVDRWVRAVEEDTVAALRARGEATAAELSADVPGLRTRFLVDGDKSWGGYQGVATRVLFLLSAEGRIVRGRPLGSWTSTRYRWSPTEAWLADGTPEPPKAEAQAELARRWLRSYGPATFADLKWWTGWTPAETKRALVAVRPVEVDLDGTTGLTLGDDLDATATPPPYATLLPALDPTMMGWTQRDWFIDGHRAALFDRSGNAGPTVWWDGRVVGGWGQRADGEIAFRLLEDVGSEARAAVDAAAARLAAWFGDLRATPRFRTPLERELTS